MARKQQECLCSCGERTGGGRFRPGHDAKLKSRLINEALAGKGKQRTAAIDRLRELGWESALERARASREARAKRQAKAVAVAA